MNDNHLSARLRFWVALAILCAPPLVLGIQGTKTYEWPDEPDFFAPHEESPQPRRAGSSDSA